MKLRLLIFVVLGVVALALVRDCVLPQRRGVERPARGDDVIVVGGQRFHTGTTVVLWDDAGGYDGYLEQCFGRPSRALPSNPAPGCDTPERYGVRDFLVEASGGETRRLMREHVDQFVIHYDAAGSSRRCFEVLHDERGLSSHFLLDVDGVIYQTLDIRERARHAREANDRSVGIEIANFGAYGTVEALLRAAGFNPRGRPQDDAVIGYVQGRRLHQYPFTDAQYDALILLTQALRNALPRIEPVCPLDDTGGVFDRVLDAARREQFSGIVGHFHVSAAKVDPGPAFDWVRYLRGVNDIPDDR